MAFATKVHSSFWNDEDVGALSAEQKLAALWIMTTSGINNIGFLKVSRRQFEFETGLPLKALEGACKGLPRAFVVEERDGALEVLCLNYVHYQFGDVAFSAKNLIAKNLLRLFMGLSDVMKGALSDRYKGLISLLQGASIPGISGTSPLQAPYKPLEGDRKVTEQSRAEQSRALEGVQGEPVFEAESAETGEVTRIAANGTLRWDLARQCLQFLNLKSGASFLETHAMLHEIALRLHEVDQDAEGVKAMIERQAALWAADGKMQNYLRPTTLFGPRFAEYYGQRALALAPAGGTDRAGELAALIDKSRANKQSVYHSPEATEAERQQLTEWRRELQQVKTGAEGKR